MSQKTIFSAKIKHFFLSSKENSVHSVQKITRCQVIHRCALKCYFIVTNSHKPKAQACISFASLGTRQLKATEGKKTHTNPTTCVIVKLFFLAPFLF